MFFYGGHNRGVRQLKDCEVQNIGFLPFTHDQGFNF